MNAIILAILAVLFTLTFTAHATSTNMTHHAPQASRVLTNATAPKADKQTQNPTASPSEGKPPVDDSPTYSPTYVLPSYLCEKRFDLAWEANVAAGLPIAATKEDMKEQCKFDATNTESSPYVPNLSCPFIYTTETGFLYTKTEVIAYLSILTSNEGIGQAVWLFQMYCQCQQGYDLGCTSKIPHGPSSREAVYDYGSVSVSSYSEFICANTLKERAKYCAFAGIWNGDFDLDNLYHLPRDVQDCGCFWVGQAQEMLDDCPGVDLGAFFIDPTTSTNLADTVNCVGHVGTSWRQNLTKIMAGKWEKN